jgi:hypothetical protein
MLPRVSHNIAVKLCSAVLGESPADVRIWVNSFALWCFCGVTRRQRIALVPGKSYRCAACLSRRPSVGATSARAWIHFP